MEWSIVESESASEPVEPVELEEAPEQDGNPLEELSQEIRRVGRELFKTNRASERNQELFETALAELRELTAAVARVPAQSAEAAFEARAALCRELLGVADGLEASLAAGREALARLEETARQPAHGMVFRFATARQIHDALAGSVEVMRQWRAGQELLYERLMTALHSAGLRAIEAVGRPFDPALHRAGSVALRDDLPSGTIVAEERKGYQLDGRVLRYAEVVVARNG